MNIIKANKRGKCPHCGVVNKFIGVSCNLRTHSISSLTFYCESKEYFCEVCECTNCDKLIVFIDNRMVFPQGSSRPPCPPEVSPPIAEDYKEACLVEPYSQKAAAALARRCLQNLLHEQGVKKRNLDQEIEEAIQNLPSSLAKSLDAIRTIGNFATHPIKYKQTGKIVSVEPGATAWTLDVLEGLFDYYYVQPAELDKKRKLLNKKLKAAGKPLLK